MNLRDKILSTKLPDDQLALFYLGQVGFLMKFRGKTIVVDPYLTDYVDRNCCSELVTWKRRYPAPITPEELDFADYVFCTHAHYDHADPDTLRVLAQRNPKTRFFVTEPIREVLTGYGIEESRITGLHTDQSTVFDRESDMTVTAIPAAHEDIHRASSGDCLEVGFRFSLGGITVYHSGDCCLYSGLEERVMDTDIEILPINGRDYYRTVVKDIIGCFDSTEAVTLAAHTHAKLLIPVHFDLYDVNCVNPAYFVDCLKTQNPEQCFHIFTPGERYLFV